MSHGNLIAATLAATVIAYSGAGAAAEPQQEIVISVPGVPGPYCAYGVEKRLLELKVIDRVQLLWEKEQIRATLKPGGEITESELAKLMASADYPYGYNITFK